MSKIRKAENEHEKAVKETLDIEREKEKFDTAEKRPRGRRPHFEQRIEQAEREEEQAKKDLEQAQANYETVRDAKAEIGTVYHPYSLKSGEKQDSRTVFELLSGCFDKIHELAKDLSDRCRERINKAQRVVNHMVGTITFFFRMIDIYLGNMQLSDDDRWLMSEYLIPGYYLKLAANKERDIQRKAEIHKKSEELLSVTRSLFGPSRIPVKLPLTPGPSP